MGGRVSRGRPSVGRVTLRVFVPLRWGDSNAEALSPQRFAEGMMFQREGAKTRGILDSRLRGNDGAASGRRGSVAWRCGVGHERTRKTRKGGMEELMEIGSA